MDRVVIPELNFTGWREEVQKWIIFEDWEEKVDCACGWHPFGGVVNDKVWEDELHEHRESEGVPEDMKFMLWD